MTERKHRDEYTNAYEWRRDTMHRELYRNDDEPQHYGNCISYYRVRPQGETAMPIVKNRIVPRPESFVVHYDKSYEVKMVVRMMKDVMYTKKLTKCKDGVKRRLTFRKSFLDFEIWDAYTFQNLVDEVRYACRNDVQFILLSSKDVSLIEGK